MVQQLHPLSVIDPGAFVFVGGATDITNIAEDVDSADGDTTHALSFADISAPAPIFFYLDAGVDPVSSVDHVLRFSAKVTDASGSHELNGTLNGDTDGTIATFDFNLTTSYAVYEYTLSGGEADAITDFSNLWIQIEAPADTVELRISAVEFDIPAPILEVVEGERIPPIEVADSASWTSHGGSYESVLQEAVNAADGDGGYVRQDTDNAYLKLGISGVVDPESSTDHTIRVSARRESTGGGGSLSVELRQSGTLIATLTGAATTTSYAVYEYELSSGEADSITDYSALQIWMNCPSIGTDPFRVSAVEFVAPSNPLSPSGGNDMRAARRSMPTTGTTVGFTLPTGFGTPKAAIFIVSGGTSDASLTTVSRSCMSIGWTDGTRQRCWGFGNEGATTGNENGWRFASSIHCIAMSNAAGGNRGLATFNSFGVDLITLNIATAFTDANRVTVWAINGNDVLVHANHTPILAGGGSAVAITDPGFQPNVLIPIGDRDFTGAPTWVAGARSCVGFAVDRPSGIQQVCEAWESVDNVSTIQAKEIVASDCVSGNNTTGGTTPGGKITVNSFDATGFTMQNLDTPSGNVRVGYLAMYIPDSYLWAGILDTSAATGPINNTQPGLGPQAMFAVSGMVDTVDTFKTDIQASTFGFGLACGPTTALTVDGCAMVYVQDADTVPTNAAAIADSKVGRAYEPGGGSLNTADFVEWLPSGVRLSWGNVAASARKWPALFIGKKTSLPPKKRSSQQALLIR